MMKHDWQADLLQDLHQLLVDEEAFTTREYALLLALLVMGCAACFQGLGRIANDTAGAGDAAARPSGVPNTAPEAVSGPSPR